MIKAIWLAVLCGVVFAVAAAVRDSGDAPVATMAEAEPTTVGVSVAPDSESESTVMKRAVGEASTTAASMTASSADTLTKADRLEVAPPPAPADTALALPVAALPAKTPPVSAPPTPAPAKGVTKTADRSRHDANAKMTAAPAPARQAKTTPPKKAMTVARAKAETKCRRPEGFAGFLRSLNIGPRCAT